jgi:predicted amidohydrolase
MTAATFTAALVQLRSGLDPQANLDTAVKLIGEAQDRGAAYVQTPEMTNIMVLQHEQLFAAIVSEENDSSLATFRELARALEIHVHIGSLAIRASADKAVNRSFLIDPKGEIVARYDKIHMFDVDLANGESYRESRNYRAGDFGVVADLPWGRLGLTICYDLRFPALYRGLAEAGRPAKRIGMCCNVPAPSRMAASSSPRRKAASTRTAARPSAIHSSLTPGGASWPKAEPNRGSCWPRSIRPRSPPPARAFPRCSTAGGSRSPSRWPSRFTCAR